MLVQEIMNKDVVAIDCKKTIYDACKVYKEKKVGCLVVMDNDILVGIVTERDIIERAILQDKSPRKTKIRDIMSSNLRTIHALAPIEKASQVMKENYIKKLPVVLNNKIVGIITQTDLSDTVDIYSEAFKNLAKFYEESKDSLEKILNEWENIIYGLKGYKKSIEQKKSDLIKEELI
jgi:malate dehydrogenase (oxaloacetate-decarboxylating)